MTRTSERWQRLPTQLQVFLLLTLLPGVFLHEMTHLAVARPWTEQSTIDWDDLACHMYWKPGTGTAPRIAAHIAPLVCGYALGLGVFAVLIGQPQASVHSGLFAYASINWVIYTGASLSDLRPILDVRNGAAEA